MAVEQQVKEFESLVELLEDLDREGITGIARVRTMGNFLLRKSRLQGKPYSASFELTPLCNFSCKMCYMHLTKEQVQREGRILSTEEWLDIARQAVDAGVMNVDLTGGECLTHPGFAEIFRYLVERGVHVSVLTNGQLLHDKHIELFTRYRPVVVQISLYGSNSEGYVRVTGKDAFSDVLNAINQLKEAGIRVSLTVMPNRFMKDDAPAILDLLHSLNIDYRIGMTTLPARPETGRQIEEYIIDNEAYVDICKLEEEYQIRMAEKYSLPPSKRYDFRIKGQDQFVGIPCAAGAAHFHINWKGEMQPCVGFHGITRSVLEDGLDSAWVWIRELMKQYSTPSECQSCEYKKSCVGCAAEKTSGVFNGSINKWVCKRLKDFNRLSLGNPMDQSNIGSDML